MSSRKRKTPPRKISTPTKKFKATDVHPKSDMPVVIPMIAQQEVFPLPRLPENTSSVFGSMVRSVLSLNLTSLSQIYYLRNYKLIPVDSAIIQGCGKQMPLMGRKEYYDTIWEYAVRRLKGIELTDNNKYANARIYVVGSPGIGKTRFALQLPHELERRAAECGDKEIKKRFVNTLFVRISFDNGSEVEREEDILLKDKPTYFVATYLLVSRALKSLFGIPFSNWNINNLPAWFKMSNLAQYLSHGYSTSNHELTIYWHLDDIQMLIGLGELVASEAIKILTELHKNSPSVLLFSGTMVSPIAKNIPLANSLAEFPLVHLQLRPLNSSEIDTVIDTIASTSSWKCLPKEWSRLKAFKTMLNRTAGVPRMLELVLQAIYDSKKSIADAQMNDIQAEVLKLFQYRYSRLQLQKSIWKIAISWTFTGRPYKADLELKAGTQSISLENLVASGMVQVLPHGEKTKTVVPFLYILLMETELIPRGFDQFWAHLRNPSNTFTWQEFETLSCMYQLMRVNAFLDCGINSVYLEDLFSAATLYNVGLYEVVLDRKQYFPLKHHWPGTTVWPVMQDSIIIEEEAMLDYLFKNADGGPADAIELYKLKSPPGKFIMIAHQNKFTSDGKTELKAADIIEEWCKVKNAIRSKYSESYWKFMRSVSMVLFFFTNRSVDDDIAQQVEDQWIAGKYAGARPSYIVTTDLKAYLGPFRNTVKSFNL